MWHVFSLFLSHILTVQNVLGDASDGFLLANTHTQVPLLLLEEVFLDGLGEHARCSDDFQSRGSP